MSELYRGEENPINILLEKRVKFTCMFRNIRNYPFGTEECSLSYYLQGNDNDLTRFHPQQIVDRGPEILGQYVIKRWTLATELDKGGSWHRLSERSASYLQ